MADGDSDALTARLRLATGGIITWSKPRANCEPGLCWIGERMHGKGRDELPRKKQEAFHWAEIPGDHPSLFKSPLNAWRWMRTVRHCQSKSSPTTSAGRRRKTPTWRAPARRPQPSARVFLWARGRVLWSPVAAQLGPPFQRWGCASQTPVHEQAANPSLLSLERLPWGRWGGCPPSLW